MRYPEDFQEISEPLADRPIVQPLDILQQLCHIYDSAYKGTQQKLKALLDEIRRKRYDVLLVYSLDRFSRQAPSKVNRLLDELVEQDGCRFISRLEGIDSDNELTWNVVRPIFAYFANLYSRGLSERIKAGIHHKGERGAGTS